MPRTVHRYRVHIFHLRDVGGWTWCPEIDGDPKDHIAGLPRCKDYAAARAAALEWLATRYERWADHWSI